MLKLANICLNAQYAYSFLAFVVPMLLTTGFLLIFIVMPAVSNLHGVKILTDLM
jgi:hypothetical protein